MIAIVRSRISLGVKMLRNVQVVVIWCLRFNDHGQRFCPGESGTLGRPEKRRCSPMLQFNQTVVGLASFPRILGMNPYANVQPFICEIRILMISNRHCGNWDDRMQVSTFLRQV